jgi:hypothetical protein
MEAWLVRALVDVCSTVVADPALRAFADVAGDLTLYVVGGLGGALFAPALIAATVMLGTDHSFTLWR